MTCIPILAMVGHQRTSGLYHHSSIDKIHNYFCAVLGNVDTVPACFPPDNTESGGQFGGLLITYKNAQANKVQ